MGTAAAGEAAGFLSETGGGFPQGSPRIRGVQCSSAHVCGSLAGERERSPGPQECGRGAWCTLCARAHCQHRHVLVSFGRVSGSLPLWFPETSRLLPEPVRWRRLLTGLPRWKVTVRTLKSRKRWQLSTLSLPPRPRVGNSRPGPGRTRDRSSQLPSEQGACGGPVVAPRRRVKGGTRTSRTTFEHRASCVRLCSFQGRPRVTANQELEGRGTKPKAAPPASPLPAQGSFLHKALLDAKLIIVIAYLATINVGEGNGMLPLAEARKSFK